MLAAEQLARVICVDCTLAASWRNQSPARAWTTSTTHSWQGNNIGTGVDFRSGEVGAAQTEDTETREEMRPRDETRPLEDEMWLVGSQAPLIVY